MRTVADRLSVRWYLGYDLDEGVPAHSNVTKIRERYGLDTFRRFFEAIVEQGQEAPLVWGKDLSSMSMPLKVPPLPPSTRSSRASPWKRTSPRSSRPTEQKI